MDILGEMLALKRVLVNPRSLAAAGGATVKQRNGRMVVSNRSIRNSQNLAVPEQSARIGCRAHTNILSLAPVAANIWKNGTGENPFPAATYWEYSFQPYNGVSVDESNGDTEVPFTVGGRKGVWLQSGQVAKWDELDVNLGAGDFYAIKCYVRKSRKAVPAAPGLATATTGGSLVAGTYWVSITYLYPEGEETPGSLTTSIVVPAGTATNTITVTAPTLATGAIGWKAYVGFHGVQAPQYLVQSDYNEFGTNYVYTNEVTSNQAAVPCVVGDVAINIPGGTGLSGGTGTNYSLNNGDGVASNLYCLGNGRRIPVGVATASVGFLCLEGRTVNGKAVAIVGDSEGEGTGDVAYACSGSAAGGNLQGGGMMRAMHNQAGNARHDPTITPEVPFVLLATGGERGDQFRGPSGNRRRRAGYMCSTMMNCYGTNDYGAQQTAAQVITTIYNEALAATKAGLKYIHLTTLPRTSSINGWLDIAGQSYIVIAGTGSIQFEGYRRQSNWWMQSSGAQAIVPAESLYSCYATATSAANVYAGGNGVATKFIPSRPFVTGTEAVKVNGVAKALTTDYTYDNVQTIGGVSFASAVIFTAAPGNGLSVTMGYTSLAGMQALVPGSDSIDWAAGVEDATAKGFWKAPVGGVFASGTATGDNTNSKITDPSKAWTINQWVGYTIRIVTDTTTPAAVGQVLPIGYNSATALNSAISWTTTPSVAATYVVEKIKTVEGVHPTPQGHMDLAAEIRKPTNWAKIV